MKRAIIATLVFLVVITLPFIMNAASGRIANAELKPDLENEAEMAKRDGATQCVDTKDYMRINHQQLLKEERVKYVRQADPNPKHSIKACFTCHDYKNFCQKCHNYNGAQPSCLSQTGGCHSTEQPDYPRPEV